MSLPKGKFGRLNWWFCGWLLAPTWYPTAICIVVPEDLTSLVSMNTRYQHMCTVYVHWHTCIYTHVYRIKLTACDCKGASLRWAHKLYFLYHRIMSALSRDFQNVKILTLRHTKKVTRYKHSWQLGLPEVKGGALYDWKLLPVLTDAYIYRYIYILLLKHAVILASILLMLVDMYQLAF